MAFGGFGFGHYSFGNFPFGRADFGEDSITRSFPATYIEDPTTGETNTLLKNYLSIAKHQFNKNKLEIDHLPDLVDTNKIRSDILTYLGSTIGVDLDDYEPEDFRKSLVNNAILFYRIKGTSDSYKIRGKISGYDVTILNIWRIDINRRIKETTDFKIAEGAGGANQTFSGTLFTFPVLTNTLKIKVDGIVQAEDDGSGLIVNTLGSPYVVNGTIDYVSGDYTATFVSAPAYGSIISVDVSTGTENKAIGISSGGSSYSIDSVQNTPYPIYPTSLQLFDNGTLIAEDDGNGNLVASGSYGIVGTINYDLGNIKVEITPAPPMGNIITANYDKTLLAEFLFCHPDDVYEIPTGSGYWYVTLHPSIVAGNLSEVCGYCLTSYIKLRMAVLKPISISTGTENFFDRLIRKLRDITPIHIRDLLYELQMVITIDESVNIEVGYNPNSRGQEEHSWLVHSNFHRFDIIPADVVSTDTAAYVRGTVELIDD